MPDDQATESGTEETRKDQRARYKKAGEEFMQSAEELLRKKEYRKVGAEYFKTMATLLNAACLKRDIPFTGKDDYFAAMEELTSQLGAEWAERALCEVVIIQQNDEKGFLTHGQVRRFAQSARRLARWLQGL